jgi:hypothetical protein
MEERGRREHLCMPSSNMHPCLFLVEWKHSELGVRDMTDTTITFKANAGGHTKSTHKSTYFYLTR